MTGEGELLHLCPRYPFAGFIVLVDEASCDPKAGGILGCADIIQNGFITVQWFAGPVSADRGKELMFDRIPL